MNTRFNSDVYGLLPEGIEGIDSLAELAASCSGHGSLDGCPIIHRVLGTSPEASA